jgi:hypothetical protein
MMDAQIEVPSDTCPNCQRVMADGEIVVMDWMGAAVSHVVCARDASAGRQADTQ